MLFRDFKTGLAIGLSALLLSSVAEAATIGGPVPDVDSARTPDFDDRTTISTLPVTRIATEIFGGSARQNSRIELSAGETDVFLLFENQVRYPDSVEIDFRVHGAAFKDQSVEAVAKQHGLKAMTAGDATADPPVAARLVPLFWDDSGTRRPVRMNQLFDETGARSTTDVTDSGGTVTINRLADSDLVGPGTTAYTGADAVVIMDEDDVVSSLIPFGGATDKTCIFNPRGDDVLRARSCGPAMGETPVAALHITPVVLDSAQGLEEAGSTVSLSAVIKDPDDDEVFDSAPATTYYRSANTVAAAIEATGRVGIDPNADPAFSKLVLRSGEVTETNALIGTITATVTATTDEEGTAVSAASLIENADITLSHGVFSDDAFMRVQLGAMRAPSRTVPIEGDSATFEVGVNSLASTEGANAILGIAAQTVHDVKVYFNGDDAIASWGAGEATVSFNDDDASDALSVPAGATGSLAAFTRGGLNAYINMAQSSYGDGATRYQSWIRIANNGVSDGDVTVQVYDSATGDRLGHWPSGIIPAGGSIQVSVAALEDHIGLTPTSADQYDIRIDGDINGYVQHVMWNTVDGLFSDLSSFRAGGGLNITP